MSEAKYIKKIDSGDHAVRVQQGGESEQVTFGRKHSRREKVLCVAVLILLIAVIVFIVLYVLQVTKKSSPEKPGEQATPSTIQPLCLSPGCIQSASGQFMSLLFFSGFVS